MTNLNRQISVGTLWNLVELFVSRSATTLFTIFLATLLAPKDFGLIAIVAIVFELSGVLVNAGFVQALIRSKAVSDRDLSTVFWANLGIAIVLYFVVFSLAGHVSNFFSEPKLTLLIQVLGVGIVISSCKIVQVAILSRAMNFRPQMIASTIGVVVSGSVAITLAKFGYGVWSLVAQMLVAQSVSVAILWTSTRWKPSLTFDALTFKQLFHFGKHVAAANVLNIAFKNSYVVVIGKLFSPEIAGLYYFASKLSSVAGEQLSAALQKSSFPALATLQDSNETLRQKYRQIIQLTMFVIAPTMFMFAGLAPVVFELLFDERWTGAILYTQLLCAVGLLFPVHSLNVNVLMVKGRSDLNLKLGLVKKAIQVAILIISIPYGVLGVVVGQVVGACVSLLPNSYYSAKLINYSFKMQMLDLIRPVLAGFLGGATAWLVSTYIVSSSFVTLIAGSAAGAIAYLVAICVFQAEGGLLIWEKIINGRKTRSL